jgi:hypothetical protein
MAACIYQAAFLSSGFFSALSHVKDSEDFFDVLKQGDRLAFDALVQGDSFLLFTLGPVIGFLPPPVY